MTQIKEVVKKRRTWIYVVIAFLLGLLAMWFFMPKKVNPELASIQSKLDSLKSGHARDSVFYVNYLTSLDRSKDSLKVVLSINRLEIVRLRALFAIKKDSVKNLPPTDAVKYFTERTGEPATIVADSMVVTTLEAIEISNVLAIDMQGCIAEKTALSMQVTIQDSLIKAEDRISALKSKMIEELRRDYYQSQQITTDQKAVIDKQKKRIRTMKSIAIGAGALGILGLVVGAVN